MFSVGDSVVYGLVGICKIKAISTLDFSGIPNDKLYYTLQPMNSSEVIYLPLESGEAKMRRTLTREEAEKLIAEIPSIQALPPIDQKEEEAIYRDCLHKYDYVEWIRLIKYLYNQKQKRLQVGKSLTQAGEKYMKLAESVLYQELAVALEIPTEDVLRYITEKTENRNT